MKIFKLPNHIICMDKISHIDISEPSSPENYSSLYMADGARIPLSRDAHDKLLRVLDAFAFDQRPAGTPE